MWRNASQLTSFASSAPRPRRRDLVSAVAADAAADAAPPEEANALLLIVHAAAALEARAPPSVALGGWAAAEWLMTAGRCRRGWRARPCATTGRR